MRNSAYLKLSMVVAIVLLGEIVYGAPPKAKISLDQAKEIATKKIPGTVKSSEFEHEMGQDVYSFDIMGNDKAIHEILVNANTGKIVSSKVETAAQEAKEAREDSMVEKATLSLVADSSIVLPGTPQKFDFMQTDISKNRILAAHRGAKTLELVDLSTNKPLKAIEVGHVQGVAIDPKSHKYFLGNESEHSIVTVDSNSLAKISEVSVDGPVDAIAFDGKNSKLYAAEDDGDHLWVLNTVSGKLEGTISLPGIPEDLGFDPATDRIFVNIKNKNLVARINPNTNKVESTWSTLPATSPHGLVIDTKRGRIYSAGSNGKLVSLDSNTGKIVSSADIEPKVDQIAFDTNKEIIYSACRGTISITKVSGDNLKTISSVRSPVGAHTLAVDSRSHDVWISYADQAHSYLQRFELH